MDAGEDRAADGGASVRLVHCPHGAYHLTVGGVTLHLTEAELALLGRAIHVMAGRKPALLERLIAQSIDDERGDEETS
jgi:hypothetical protein